MTRRHPALGLEAVRRRLGRRYRTELGFRLACVAALALAASARGVLFLTVLINGASAFRHTFVALDVHFDPETLDPEGTGDPEVLAAANYQQLVREALTERFPEASDRSGRRDLGALVSIGAAFRLQEMVSANPALVGLTQRVWVPASDEAELMVTGEIPRETPEEARPLDDRQLAWLDALAADGALERRFNREFLTSGDSREPELAGVWGAVVGSFYTMLVTLALSFPLGISAAVYLQEFAPRNRWTDLIEININNLAAVPSIVYGLLGLAVFLNWMNMPRSAPVVGGMVLALMTLPRIIIPARAALASVPPSIRQAAYGLGASPLQVVAHHVLPLAVPGILTGTIIGMAQALGETAPLLMIGMVAFIVDVPAGFLDPATVLPVQVYLWADSPERAFVAKTSAAILVLLAFLLVMNVTAVVIRRRTERRW